MSAIEPMNILNYMGLNIHTLLTMVGMILNSGKPAFIILCNLSSNKFHIRPASGIMYRLTKKSIGSFKTNTI
jgi:hypothetical protein